ncbi:MAG: type III secretion system chaperone [Verrucomicrobia bacterium]|jgi:hypothetical protein|nr:type III secretion system chaperone [Verrucomicrobiota bacterium]
MLDTILFDLEKHLQIKPVKGVDEMKAYTLLEIGDEAQVWVKELDKGLFLQSKIAPLFTPKDREAFYIYIMKANFLGQGTGGATIGIDPDEKFLTLSLVIPYEVNYKLFKDRLEDFVNYLAYWRKEFKNHEVPH